MNKNYSSGFTLIELLVVISIIGVLSSVVLASLNTARSKGNDAAIQSNLATIHTQAEIYYMENANTYGTTVTSCTTGMFASSVIAKAITQTDSANGSGSVVCNASATAYAVQAQLSSDTAKYWCIDSTGNAKQTTTALGSGVYVCS